MGNISCPWCGQRNQDDALECHKCGGPLPVMDGQGPGPNPPMPPRRMPRGFKRRMLLANSVSTIVGLIFLGVGLPFAIIFPIIGLQPGMTLMLVIGGGLGGLFTLMGGAMIYFGIRRGLRKIRPFEHGLATIGEIVDLYQDTRVSVNGRHPWAIVYSFQVYGFEHSGQELAWQRPSRNLTVGSQVHVLYMPDNPQENVTYPPPG